VGVREGVGVPVGVTLGVRELEKVTKADTEAEGVSRWDAEGRDVAEGEPVPLRVAEAELDAEGEPVASAVEVVEGVAVVVGEPLRLPGVDLLAPGERLARGEALAERTTLLSLSPAERHAVITGAAAGLHGGRTPPNKLRALLKVFSEVCRSKEEKLALIGYLM
jgi:hypothetical protein